MGSPLVDHIEQQTRHPAATPGDDAKVYIQDWGRSGMILGANFGIILGAIFVAIPFTAAIPALGLVRTLMVGAIACALMAGGFAAIAAALYSKRRGHVLSFARFRTISVARTAG